MTIVVAGHYENEIFFITDSAITNNNKTLLSGFKKVYGIPIQLHVPLFVPYTFSHYIPFEGFKAECVFALSGSTLIGQHVINSISEHLGKIRVIHSHTSSGLRMSLLRHCCISQNPMYRPEYIEYDNTLYSPTNVYKAINKENIIEIIEYSIQESFSSAFKHVCDDEGVNWLLENQFMFGVNCSKTQNNFLFKVTLKEDYEDGILKIKVCSEEIKSGQLGIIGLTDNSSLTKQYLEKINNVYLENIRSEHCPLILLKLIEDIVDNANAKCYRAVAKPIIYKKFDKFIEKSIMISRNSDWHLLDKDQITLKIIKASEHTIKQYDLSEITT